MEGEEGIYSLKHLADCFRDNSKGVDFQNTFLNQALIIITGKSSVTGLKVWGDFVGAVENAIFCEIEVGVSGVETDVHVVGSVIDTLGEAAFVSETV